MTFDFQDMCVHLEEIIVQHVLLLLLFAELERLLAEEESWCRGEGDPEAP